MIEEKPINKSLILLFVLGIIFVLVGLAFVIPAYSRYQSRAYAENQVYINETVIKQTVQLVQVENQKAQIRIAEANGIAEAQHIINATLTDRYLVHESIQAQEKMANSPNHSTIYIPSGNMGIPVVRTENGDISNK